MSARKKSFPATRTFSPVPVHPGEHLLQDFMRPLGLSVNVVSVSASRSRHAYFGDCEAEAENLT
jgi:hypothetical protein